jgi:hypothetical protein
MNDFPKLSGGVKVKKFGENGVADMATRDADREVYRK